MNWMTCPCRIKVKPRTISLIYHQWLLGLLGGPSHLLNQVVMFSPACNSTSAEVVKIVRCLLMSLPLDLEKGGSDSFS